MSRTVKIPDNLQPWECEINGVKYGPYPAGSIQTVPDEVGSVIDAYYSSLPVENPPETLEEEITRLATQIADEKVAEATAPAVVSLEYDEVEETWRGNKTYEEIDALCSQGKQVVVDFDIPSFDGWAYRAPITLYGRYDDDDTVYYWFEIQIVDPNTSSLMALVATGVADDRTWSMYAYPMSDPGSGE